MRSLCDAASPPGCERTSHHQTQPHHKPSEKPGGDTGWEAGDRDMANQSLDRSCLGARCPLGTLVWAWEGEEVPHSPAPLCEHSWSGSSTQSLRFGLW